MLARKEAWRHDQFYNQLYFVMEMFIKYYYLAQAWLVWLTARIYIVNFTHCSDISFIFPTGHHHHVTPDILNKYF